MPEEKQGLGAEGGKDDESSGPTLVERRRLLMGLPAAGLGATLSCRSPEAGVTPAATPATHTAGLDVGGELAPGSSNAEPVEEVFSLGMPWRTFDPFLFCVHHDDAYPVGNPQLGPAASLAGRNLGSDFEGLNGWRMYHGDVVPGFPRHPHRGFETVTITRRGYIDHSDSLGATARYGQGDVQWMTAGRGIVHAEMFPLLHREEPNPTELFQIWLNLPRARKFVEPHFSMLWGPSIPNARMLDEQGRAVELRIIAGQFQQHRAPSPPPASWAAQPDADVAIWSLRLAAGARFVLPKTEAGTDRTLYFFTGQSLRVGNRELGLGQGARLRADVDTVLGNGAKPSEVLLLQGRPIGEPVVQQGPFVMNTAQEIREAYADYRRTGFGGWPWNSSDPVHAATQGRFAIHADGSRELAPV